LSKKESLALPCFLVYVDDALAAAAEEVDIIAVVADLRKYFEVRDMGDAKMLFGKEIIHDWEAQRHTVTQEKFTQGLLERLQMSAANARRTLMNSGMNLRSQQVDGEGLDSEQKHTYAELVGGLLYLAGSTRPDIGCAVSVLLRFMDAPTKAHWEGIKGEIRYLVGTCHCGMTFGSNTAGKVFGVSDFAADLETRRSTPESSSSRMAAPSPGAVVCNRPWRLPPPRQSTRVQDRRLGKHWTSRSPRTSLGRESEWRRSTATTPERCLLLEEQCEALG
jgi:hypothetical protein